MQPFKQIKAWQRAHALGIALHRATAGYARKGCTNLKSQLTRAADAISTNSVEGCGAATSPEFARFLDIAIKSANETEHHLLCARDRGVMGPDAWARFTTETVEIRKMTFAYRRKVLENRRETPDP
jgi:four helix bundle protein